MKRMGRPPNEIPTSTVSLRLPAPMVKKIRTKKPSVNAYIKALIQADIDKSQEKGK